MPRWQHANLSWELSIVVRNGPLMCPNTSSTPHTSSSNHSSTVVRNGPSTWLCCILTSSTQVVTCPSTVTCLPPTQSHWIKGMQPDPGWTWGCNYAMLSAPQQTPHCSTAVCALHAWLVQYHHQSYKLNSSSCIVVDYYNKSEWKFGKEYYWPPIVLL